MMLIVPLPWCKRIRLKELLNDSKQVWKTHPINWYGGEMRQIEYITFVCLWYHAGCAAVTLRIVLAKTPGGKNEAEAFFSTNTTFIPIQIIRYFVQRWNIEVTFEETRAHLDLSTHFSSLESPSRRVQRTLLRANGLGKNG